MKLLFLDTETTDVKADSHAVQIAMKEPNQPTQIYYHEPPCPISFGAMAVHHITEEMIKGAAPILGEVVRHYNTYLLDKTVVCHNQDFDRRILGNDGVRFGDGICTLKVARKVYPDMEQHKLQYLRYALGLNIEARAHDAGGDVDVLEQLFNNLLTKISIDEMLEISKQPTVLINFYFGKYRNQKIVDIIKNDRDYINWLLKQATLDNEMKYSINYHLKNL